MSENLDFRVNFDVSQANRAISDMQAKIGEIADSTKRTADVTDSWLNKAKIGLDAFNGAVSAIKSTYSSLHGVLEGAMKTAVSQQVRFNLELTIGADATSKLAEATRGYIGRGEMMKLALRATSGELRLTTEQILLVANASKTLADRGFEFSEAFDAMVRAFHGQTRSVKEYGFHVAEAGDKQAQLNDLIRQMQDVAAKGANTSAGLKLLRDSQADLEDAAKLWAKTVSASVIWVTAQIREMVSEIKWVLRDLGIIEDRRSPATRRWETGWQEAEAQAVMAGQVTAAFGGGAPSPGGRATVMDALSPRRFKKRYVSQENLRVPLPEETFSLEESRQDQRDYLQHGRAVVREAEETIKLSRGIVANVARLSEWTATSADQARRFRPSMGAVESDLEARRRQVGEWAAQDQEQALTAWQRRDELARGLGMAGNPDLTDRELEAATARMEEHADSLRVATAAYGAFTDAALAGIDAAITGQDAIGAAMLRAAAAALKGIALQASASALFELGSGLRDSALLLPTAAAHYAAAAKFAACAVVAGVGAYALGQAVPSTGGGSGAGASASQSMPRSQSAAQAPVIIVVGGDYSGDPHGAARAIDRGLAAARRAGRITTSSVIVRA